MDKRKDYDAKDAWLVVDGKKVMNLNINDEPFYGLGDLAINKNGLKSMKYYKYGHGKWINEDSGEELLKAMVDYRLRQMMGFFYDLA